MFSSIEEYEYFVYTLSDRVPEIKFSTLVLKRIGATVAKLEGKLFFKNEIELNILEIIDFEKKRLKTYSYEAYQNKEKIYWYDSWSHPHDESLAITEPHHKHVPPDIKHNRIPAPGISFYEPNLLLLIEEVKQQLLEIN